MAGTVRHKTHSGAKKRLRVTGNGKLKRKKVGLRHLNSMWSSKPKRQLGKMTYVHETQVHQMRRALNI